MTLLKINSKGSNVKAWQSFLITKGLLTEKADGIFGQHTLLASKMFQNQNGLTSDGMIGAATIQIAKQQGLQFPKISTKTTKHLPFPPPNSLNALFDISHFNGKKLDFEKAVQNGMKGVLHKASQDTNFIDSMYRKNKAKAQAAGLLWGAYHFGTGSNGTAQADYFLDLVQADGDTLLVLDLERNPLKSETTMGLKQAHDFIQRIQEKTGKYPGLYGGSLIRKLLGNKKDDIFGKCWLWLSEYADHAKVPASWQQWTMWQYTDGTIGPNPLAIPGIGKCDRNLFNGNATELQAFWKEQAV